MTCGICKYFTIWLKISYHIYRTYGRGELSDKKELEATWEKSDKCPVVNDKIYKVIGSWHNDKDIFNRNSKMINLSKKKRVLCEATETFGLLLMMLLYSDVSYMSLLFRPIFTFSAG